MSTASPISQTSALDYTAVIARDMASMRRFYEDVLKLEMTRELSPN